MSSESQQTQLSQSFDEDDLAELKAEMKQYIQRWLCVTHSNLTSIGFAEFFWMRVH